VAVISKPIDAISKQDIENLVAARVSERRTLDYKKQLPGGRDDDKREFLYDVASFAEIWYSESLMHGMQMANPQGCPILPTVCSYPMRPI
jgi:hypothetical protein